MATAFDLRPLQFGDHMGRAFSIFLRHWLLLARWIGLAYFLPVAALTILLHTVLQPYAYVDLRQHEPSLFEPSSSAAYWWLVRFGALALAHWFAAAGLLFIAARIYVGDSPGLAQTARAVFSRGAHVSGAWFVYLAGMAGILVLSFGPAFLISQGSGRDAEVQAWLWVVFAGFPGAFLLMAFFIGRFGLAMACVMLDDADSSSAFARSSRLAKGFRWRLAMLVMVMALVAGVPGLWSLLDIPGLVGRHFLRDAGSPLLADLLHLAWQGLLAPLFLLPVMVFFFDQRCRKEGYDLAVMARNFGIDDAQLLRFQMDPLLGYLPKGFKPERKARKLPPVAPPQQAWPQQAPWPQPVQAGWPQQPQAGWPQQPQGSWPQTPGVPRPASPRVFRPPQRRGGA